ncbi:MAG: MarR family transcriptional regulator [Myxococcota bacterium]
MDPLDRRRTRILARLATRVSRALQTDTIAYLQELGYPITLAHNQVLIPLDQEGTRISELARRASISAQAVGKLVDELTALGLVKREVDPTDRRARIVSYTDRGRELVTVALSRLESQHDRIADILGTERFEPFAEDLVRLAAALDPEGF